MVLETSLFPEGFSYIQSFKDSFVIQEIENTMADFDFNSIFYQQKEKAIEMRSRPIDDRINTLKRLKLLLERYRQEIRDVVYEDFKKPALEADLSETYVVISEIRHAIKHLKSWSRPRSVSGNVTYFGTSSQIQYEPKGVCLIIAPWNYPVNLLLGPAVSAIAAGNTAILKPSEITAHTSALLKKLINDNFPANELFVTEGGVDETQALLKLPFDHIFFTGGTAIGKLVMKAAAENLTSVTLELGGKSPAIIDQSADLKDAAEKIAWGKWVNNGQTCIAPDYVLVHPSKKDQFVNYLRSSIDTLYPTGNQQLKEVKDYSRVVNDKHFGRLSDMINDAVQNGATVEHGGQSDVSERLIEPTVLSNLPEDSKLLKEEIFGPVLPIVEYESVDQAIDYINRNDKPLSLYVFAKDDSVTNRVLNNTSSGSACINDCVLQFMQPNLPFGGVNHSGIGKAHGEFGFMEFSNKKSVLKQRIGLTSAKSLYPPYNGMKQKMVDFMMKYV